MILTHDPPTRAELMDLYASVGWTSYTRGPEALERAVKQSSFVVCARSDSGDLLGLARTVSDDVSICYVQDLLVRPEAHRQGVGRALMEAVLNRYAHVMQQVLITDDGAAQQAFYRSLGFHNTRDLINLPTNCYYRTPGRELS
jgi:ribosomal protein S18 acetylase RimI-like enzyme